MDKNINAVKIYSAVPNDGKGLVRVSRITWLATYPNKKFGITVKDLAQRAEFEKERIKRWRKNIKENKNRKTWVAKVRREIVGFCGANKENNTHEIGAIYVLPKYQGKGVGKRLIGKAFAWLGDRKNITVKVASYNTPSIKFYESVGFKKAGVVKKSQWHKLPSGKLLPEIMMKRVAYKQQKIFLKPSQLIAMIDYPPLHSPKAFTTYRKKFKSGSYVEPIVVIPIKIVVENLAKNKTRYNTYKKTLEQFLKDHPRAKYFMTGGKHRSAAATVLGVKIPSLIIKNDADVNGVNLLIDNGEITGVPPVNENFNKTLEELEEHFFEHKRFWTMDEKVRAMIENGDI